MYGILNLGEYKWPRSILPNFVYARWKLCKSPSSIAYGAAGTTNNNIQSGQAFLIQALPLVGGTLSFTGKLQNKWQCIIAEARSK